MTAEKDPQSIHHYTKSLDRQVGEMASRNNFGFISLLDEMAKDEGIYAPQEVLNDEVHLHCAKTFPIIAERVIQILAP